MSVDNGTSGKEVGSFVIDPDAERGTGSSSVTAQQEAEFYHDGGRQYKLLHNQQNLGYLGKLFGSNSSAPTNIAGFVIVFCLIILVVSFFFPANPELVEPRKWIVGLITSALSFIFGAASKH